MLFFRKTYWEFLLKSTNAHGVHSPFVYNLITRCFYNQRLITSKLVVTTIGFPSFFDKKRINILKALFVYLGVSKVFFLTRKEHAIKRFAVLEKAEVENFAEAQVIYIDHDNFEKDILVKAFDDLKNDSFMIVENPYSKLKAWNALKDVLENKVVVDTYYFALIFKKQQQAEEVFYIRV